MELGHTGHRMRPIERVKNEHLLLILQCRYDYTNQLKTSHSKDTELDVSLETVSRQTARHIAASLKARKRLNALQTSRGSRYASDCSSTDFSARKKRQV